MPGGALAADERDKPPTGTDAKRWYLRPQTRRGLGSQSERCLVFFRSPGRLGFLGFGFSVIAGTDRFVVTKQDMQRLKPTEPGEDWLPLKSTARKLGISQQTVLQKVQVG